MDHVTSQKKNTSIILMQIFVEYLNTNVSQVVLMIEELSKETW